MNLSLDGADVNCFTNSISSLDGRRRLSLLELLLELLLDVLVLLGLLFDAELL